MDVYYLDINKKLEKGTFMYEIANDLVVVRTDKEIRIGDRERQCVTRLFYRVIDTYTGLIVDERAFDGPMDDSIKNKFSNKLLDNHLLDIKYNPAYREVAHESFLHTLKIQFKLQELRSIEIVSPPWKVEL